MKNRKIIITWLIVAILLLVAIVVVYFIVANRGNEQNAEIVPQEVDSISGYEYKLEDRDTTLYKNTFTELKKTLENEDIDFSKYAELVSELYIIDLYTINNKVTKYDVGGYEFVLPSVRDNFSLKVEDTIYKYVEDNSSGKRKQDLPEVKSIQIVETNHSKFNIDDSEFDGYSIQLKWDYVKDLGYDTESIVNLVETENKVYVVQQHAKDLS